MDDTGRKHFNEFVTDRMNEIIEEHEALCEEPEKPEPKAGDVWWSATDGLGGNTVFVHRDKEGGGLKYTYLNGLTGDIALAYFVKQWRYTRIFSLVDYLKNKEV